MLRKKQAQDLGTSIALLKFGGRIYSDSTSFPAYCSLLALPYRMLFGAKI